MSSRTELFLDDERIEMTAGITRKIHHPRKHRLNPVFRPEHWWEGNCVMPLATLYDQEGKLFKMWYRTGPVDRKDKAIDGHVSYTAYATSTDGLYWERPHLGVMEIGGRRDHSVVLASEGLNPLKNFVRQGKKAFILSVIRHPHPKDEGEKYVCMFADLVKRGAYLGFSADGIHWRRQPEAFWYTPIDATSWGDDTVKSMIYDKFKERWVMYRRVIPEESERMVAQPGDETWQQTDRYLRVMGYADSADLANWENHRIVMIPDADDPADVEFYGLTCHNYEQVYVGYLWVYHGAPDKENIDIQLVTSRDGVNFTRCCRREVFLPAGQRETFDYEICMGYQAEPIIVNDDVYLFYEGCNYDHGGTDWRRPHSMVTCGLATFKRDRFVSLQTGVPQPCRLVTKAFVVDFPKLFLNSATWGDGSIHVEVLTRDWKPVDGFTADDAIEIRGNALAHPVRWNANADLGRLMGREVRLKFHMVHSRIHAMTLDTEERPLGELSDLATYENGYAQGPVDV